MVRASSFLLLVVLVFAPAAAAAQTGDAPLADLEPAPADRAALREIVRQHGVDTVPDKPGVARWIQDLATAFSIWLARGIERFAPGVGIFVESLGVIGAPLVFGLTLALLLVMIGRTLLESSRRRARAPAQVRPAGGIAAPELGRSLAEWEEELRRRLAASDAAAAAEALWWWLARTLVAGSVAASWTSRELLVHAGRSDLRPAVRRLDRLLYGAAAPTAGDVRRLWDELRGVTARPGEGGA